MPIRAYMVDQSTKKIKQILMLNSFDDNPIEGYVFAPIPTQTLPDGSIIERNVDWEKDTWDIENNYFVDENGVKVEFPAIVPTVNVAASSNNITVELVDNAVTSSSNITATSSDTIILPSDVVVASSTIVGNITVFSRIPSFDFSKIENKNE